MVPSPVAGDVFLVFLQLSVWRKTASQSRLCRDAGEDDTRHLGLWSVGRGKEDLLAENMSKDLVYISRSEIGIRAAVTLTWWLLGSGLFLRGPV